MNLIVQLDLDDEIETGFWWHGRWPVALLEQIGAAKVSLYEALHPNPLEPGMSHVERIFTINAKQFRVICGTHVSELAKPPAEVRRLRVLLIEEL